MNHAITSDGTILEPDPAAAQLAAADPAPPPATLQWQLIQAIARADALEDEALPALAAELRRFRKMYGRASATIGAERATNARLRFALADRDHLAQQVRELRDAARDTTDGEVPRPTDLERQLISALADHARANERLTQQLADAHRALALEVAHRVAGQPEPGDLVDRAERYGADLDAAAAVERLRERCRHMLNVGERFIEIGAVLRLLASHHNATAGSPT